MDLQSILKQHIAAAIKALYQQEIAPNDVQLQTTRKEFEGSLTLVVFPLTRLSKQKPPETASAIGDYLVANTTEVTRFNVVQGFLNLVISDDYWKAFIQDIYTKKDYAQHPQNGKRVMLEFSSPNTNKPLHLGHIRNNLLGWATANILKAAGNEVITTQVINDRGIHICKSMLAWKRFGKDEMPETNKTKGDHLVGKYYVRFEQEFQKEYKEWQLSHAANDIWKNHPDSKKDDSETARYAFFKDFYKNIYFNEISELGTACKRMLIDWEAGDLEVRQLWEMMNGWVLAGLAETYERLGVRFDKNYFESETYLIGKEMIEKGIDKQVFYQKNDGSTWVDLTSAKMDEKIVLRADGTSVYITQDIGMANLRYEEFEMDSMIYVVGNEQDYHFKVLFEILKRLGEPYSNKLYHLSYGMVELPDGKMKSREGTVVDADDLMTDVQALVEADSKERGELEGLHEAAKQDIWRKMGMGALKFQILKVSPTKSIIFDPKEAIDLQGQTGVYVQNAFVRTAAVLRKAELVEIVEYTDAIQEGELHLIELLNQYPSIISVSANNYDPSLVANFAYELAKTFHKFYHDYQILKAPNAGAKSFRLQLSMAVKNTLEHSFGLLGIEMPERM